MKPKQKKPRISEYSKPHATRFKKNIEKTLAIYCIDQGIRPSTIIQSAIECYLSHPQCIARKKIEERFKV